MISFEEVKRLIRFKEKDNNEIRFSDYEIKMAVNEVIRYLNNSYSLQNSDFLEKTQNFNETEMNTEFIKANLELPEEEQLPLYNFKDEGIDLPEDYVALISVMRMCDGYVMTPVQAIQKPNDNEYKVVGSKLYSGTPAFTMLYKAAIAEIKSDSDSLSRINGQVHEYQRQFNYVIVVCGQKYSRQLCQQLPKGIGLFQVNGHTDVKELRKPTRKTRLDKEEMLFSIKSAYLSKQADFPTYNISTDTIRSKFAKKRTSCIQEILYNYWESRMLPGFRNFLSDRGSQTLPVDLSSFSIYHVQPVF